MTITIDLPDDLASRLAEILPEEERSRFAVDAIAEALEARRRDSEECIVAVEQALADMDEGRNLIPFEEICRLWDAEKAARRPVGGA
jgi:predicted transcriptional regulator